MPTQCSRDLFGYEVVEGRQVVAAFDGGQMTSNAGALLLGATDRAIDLVGRFAACFEDGRAQAQVEHPVQAMVTQRVFGIALGYEDLIDHDQLRHDPVLATLAGKLEAKRTDCAPLAGKSTLNRLEHAPSGPSRYHKIGHDPGAVEGLFVELFLDAHDTPPKEIILDLDATDDPLHGHQEGRFFHDEPPASGGGRNAERDSHGETRRNDTHASTTDPDAGLNRKGRGKEAKLCPMGHLLMENRHGLIVDAVLTPVTGTAEREAAAAMMSRQAGRYRATLGADKA